MLNLRCQTVCLYSQAYFFEAAQFGEPTAWHFLRCDLLHPVGAIAGGIACPVLDIHLPKQVPALSALLPCVNKGKGCRPGIGCRESDLVWP